MKQQKQCLVLVLATDADRTSPNNEVYYIINSDAPFIINEITGEIFPNGVDFEATVDRPLDPFTVIARDKGLGLIREDIATVDIRVLNVNDEAPIFEVSFLLQLPSNRETCLQTEN